MTQTESALGDAGDAAAAGARGDGRRRQRAATAMPSARRWPSELAALREQLLAVANRGDGAGGYLFGGQGATQPPFVDAPRRRAVPRHHRQTAGRRPTTALPLAIDGEAAWLQRAHRQRRVRDARVASGGRRVDRRGQRDDPAPLTGSDLHASQFSVARRRDHLLGAARTACHGRRRTAPYASGQAIEIDGMAVDASAARRPNGDQFEIAPSTPTLERVRRARPARSPSSTTPGRTGAQIAQATADSLRDIDSVLGALQSARQPSARR